MTRQITVSQTLSAEDFAPYGTLIHRPDVAGQRQFYSDWLGVDKEGLAPVFHVNRMEPVSLPFVVTKLEKHPYAAQSFVPLDVSRYLVTVAPSLDDGSPDLDNALSFELPSSMGVIYAPGVWHAGASVLDRTGSFVVLMWRGATDDDVFTQIDDLTLLPPHERPATIAFAGGN